MIHFSAYWCMPSITMNPFFEELASTYQSVLFLNVDVDEVKVIYLYNTLGGNINTVEEILIFSTVLI